MFTVHKIFLIPPSPNYHAATYSCAHLLILLIIGWLIVYFLIVLLGICPVPMLNVLHSFTSYSLHIII